MISVPQPGEHAGAWARAESFAVPPAAAGTWCVIHAVTADQGRNVRHMLAFRNAAGDSVGARPFFRRTSRARGSRYRTIAYVPDDAATYQLSLFSPDRSITATALQFRPVSRAVSAMLLLLARPAVIPGVALRLTFGQVRRARTMLNLLAGAVTTPSDYQDWIELFDTWPAVPPPEASAAIGIAALVFHLDQARPAARDATLASLAAQGVAVPHTVLVGEQSAAWRQAAAGLPGDYIALLQAGEVLPPHAAWFTAFELQRLGLPDLAYGDEDSFDTNGHRSHPVFRPEPGDYMMLSGTQTTGVWFVRREVLLTAPDIGDPGWAECLRLALWLRRRDGEAAHVPVVLTHRRADTEGPSAAALAALVNVHLAAAAMPLDTAPALPFQLRRTAASDRRVSILIPSTLRTPLVLRCILSILQDTLHAGFELVVAVSQPGPLDAVQSQAAAQITADPRARILSLPSQSFNYSAVCNALAASTANELILLLNDDVSVQEPGWLNEMAAYFTDPRVGIVGAKLLYPDHSVQHGGVIIGLAGLCDHAHRNLPGTARGYAGRAVVTQELSAVTAACLMVRRSVFDAVHGLDEAYPSAFNDVDFCLRVREAGYGVLYVPAATLTHHEMATYGSHYSGERAGFESEEISRMQRRWASAVANDPFHSPNLDLGTGREWQLAFPPRRPRQFQL